MPSPVATPSWKLAPMPRGPAVSMRSELLVAHEKLRQFPLLTVYVVSVQGEKYILIPFETTLCSCVCVCVCVCVYIYRERERGERERE
jgi:hypothetical protein